MNSTRKTLLSLCSALLLMFGAYACKSSSSTSTTDVNTAGLNNSTGAYVGGSAQPGTGVSTDDTTEANSRVGGRENVQAATADTSYSGTGQTLVTSGQKATTTTTTTNSTPTVVATAPVAPNTTTEITTITPAPVTTAEVTTPTVTETQTTTTETTAPMTSSVQESTTTTTTPTETTTTTTHRRMHKD
jgi:hypothetical protein